MIALLLAAAIVAILVAWYKWTYGHWRRKGVDCPEPFLFFGTAKDFFIGKTSLGACFSDHYSKYKAKGARFAGCFLGGQPVFIPIELDLVKSILQTDFQSFNSHGAYYNEDVNPLTLHLFNLEGPKWKEVRSKLTPTMTSVKIRTMHQSLLECGENLKGILREFPARKTVEIKDIMSRFTTDVIGTYGFGLDISSLKNPGVEFRLYGEKIFETKLINSLRLSAPFFLPIKILKLMRFKSMDKEVMNFFYNTVMSTIKHRDQNGVVRKDFIDHMMNEKEKLSKNYIAAQSFVFFAAGYETSSTTLNFALYELAINEEIQDKLREEINRVLEKHDDEITFEAVTEMEYAEQVINETLRLYPPITFLVRKCTKKFKVPEASFCIDDGSLTVVPVMGIHRDPEFYPNPDTFDPERFNETNRKARPPFSFLPFGEGPRVCIGSRLAYHQSKLGLITILRNFRISLNSKTKHPLTYSKTGFFLRSEGGIWLDLEPIKQNS